MKEYNVLIKFSASFKNPAQVYDLLDTFSVFLLEHVPVENFGCQDIHVGYTEEYEFDDQEEVK